MNPDPYHLFYDFYNHHYDHALKDTLLALIEAAEIKGSVLEMGCGPAFIGIALALKGYQVTATDISTDFLALAQGNAKEASCPLTVEAHDILTPIPFSVDHIVMGFDVINHLATLDEFARVIHHAYTAIKPGGHVFFDSLTCAYMASMIGYQETLTLHQETLRWKIGQGPYPCSFRHRLERSGKVATLNQRTFDEATLDSLVSAFRSVQKHRLEDRIIYHLQK